MVDMIIKDVAGVAPITMRIARATEGATEVVAASEVGVGGAMMIETISEKKRGIEVHHRDHGTVGHEVLPVDMAGVYDGT